MSVRGLFGGGGKEETNNLFKTNQTSQKKVMHRRKFGWIPCMHVFILVVLENPNFDLLSKSVEVIKILDYERNLISKLA